MGRDVIGVVAAFDGQDPHVPQPVDARRDPIARRTVRAM